MLMRMRADHYRRNQLPQLLLAQNMKLVQAFQKKAKRQFPFIHSLEFIQKYPIIYYPVISIPLCLSIKMLSSSPGIQFCHPAHNFNKRPINKYYRMKSPRSEDSYISYASFTKHPLVLSGKLLHKNPVKQSQEFHIPEKKHFRNDLIAIPERNTNNLRNSSVRVITGVERLLEKAAEVERNGKSGRKHYKNKDQINLKHVELSDTDWKRQLSENKKKLTYSQSVKYLKEFGPSLQTHKQQRMEARRKRYEKYPHTKSSFDNPLNSKIDNPEARRNAKVVVQPKNEDLNYKRKYSKTTYSSIVFG